MTDRDRLLGPGPNAALFHHPDAVDTSRQALLGRHAAGEGFLKGFVRHAGVEAFHCYARRKAHYDDFVARTGPWNADGRPVHWIREADTARIGDVGCLFVQQPRLAGFAWRRRAHGGPAYSLCGVTHTTASAGAMESIAGLLTSPVQPWDAVVSTSRAVKATVVRLLDNWAGFLEQRTGGRPRPLVRLPVIPLGVDCDAFAPGERGSAARAALRRRLAIGDDDVAVLFMGRLSYHAKAHPLPMYRALEEAARHTGKRVHLIQAGWFANPTIERSFREGAAAFCPSVTAHFLDGRDPRVRAEVWFAADVFASLSDNIQETFGLTPVEAMAAGLPCVVTDWNGYRDTVRHGIDGFTVDTWMPPPGAGHSLTLPDIAEFSTVEFNRAYDQYCAAVSQCTAVDIPAATDAFTNLVGNAELRRRMGTAARQRARAAFDWRVVIATYQALWEELADIRRTADELAPRLDGRPVHPLRDDPFALFAAYPTPTAGPVTASAAEGADAEGMAALREYPMNDCAPPRAVGDADRAGLLERLLRDGRMPLPELAASVPPARRAPVLRALGWLGKMGLARLSVRRRRDLYAEACGTADGPPPRGDAVYEAVGEWRRRLAADGNDVEALKGLGSLARRRGDTVVAAALLERALARMPGDPDLNDEYGQIMLAADQADIAVACFRRVAAARPGSVSAHTNLGRALGARGDLADALAAVRRAVRLAPHLPVPWQWLGILSRRAGTPDTALGCLETSLDLDPEDADTWYHLGYAHKALGRPEEAARAWREALRLKPRHVYATAAQASLAVGAATASGRRIALHMNKPFHYPILRPLFDLFAERDPALFTADSRDLRDFDPHVIIICDAQARTLRPLLPGATFVYVRHGLTSKNHFAENARLCDYVCVTSDAARDEAVAAGLPARKLWVTGYLQMDPLFRDGPAALPFAIPDGRKTVLYAPTHNPRMASAPMLGDRVVELIRGGREDVTVIIKPHPETVTQGRMWMDWWRKAAAADADVHLVDDPAADVAAYLKAADVVVSDASSVAFQFLALDRPVVLVRNPQYADDAPNYDPDGIEWRWRDVGDDIDDVSRLAAAVHRALDDPAHGAERRAHYRERLLGAYTDGRAAERIVSHVTALSL